MENTRELSLFLKKTTNELDFTAGDIAKRLVNVEVMDIG